MSWKVTIVGGLVFFVVTTIVGWFGTGILIHEMILDPVYQANESFWVPELREDPPDMATLMPAFLASGLLGSLVIAGIYSCVRGSFAGPGWRKGLLWGLCLAIFMATVHVSYSGFFDLPPKLWLWWAIDGFIIYLIGGAALGWAAERWA